MNATILFIIVGLIILVSTLWGFKRGILVMMIPFLSFAISVMSTYYLTEPITKFVVKETSIYKNLKNEFKTKNINDKSEKEEDKSAENKYIEDTNYPQMVKDALISGNNAATYAKLGVQNFKDYLAGIYARSIIKLGVSFALFLVVYIVMRIICRVLRIANRLPVLHGVSSILGGVIGLAIGILISIIVVTIIVAATMDMSGLNTVKDMFSNRFFNEMINKNYLIKWLL